jgi:hypothetical protein
VQNLDALLADAFTPSGRLCVIGKTLAELPDPYLTALNDMLTNGTASAVIAARLKSAGLRGSDKSVQFHRRRLCGCPQEVTA